MLKELKKKKRSSSHHNVLQRKEKHQKILKYILAGVEGGGNY
jgi:hypothetical protein